MVAIVRKWNPLWKPHEAEPKNSELQIDTNCSRFAICVTHRYMECLQGEDCTRWSGENPVSYSRYLPHLQPHWVNNFRQCDQVWSLSHSTLHKKSTKEQRPQLCQIDAPERNRRLRLRSNCARGVPKLRQQRICAWPAGEFVPSCFKKKMRASQRHPVVRSDPNLLGRSFFIVTLLGGHHVLSWMWST